MRPPLLTVPAGMLALVLGCASSINAQNAVLHSDDFEDRPEVNVQVRAANQPYTVRTIGLTQEKAHSGKTSVKIDLKGMHGLEVQLAPRTTAKPVVEYGSIGSAGAFSLPGLDLPLQRDRGYLLEVWVWVERVDGVVRICVENVTDSPYGTVTDSQIVGATISKPTGEWVKIEQELTASLLEQKDAAGDKIDGLRLNAVHLSIYLPWSGEVTAYVDDVSIREMPPADIAAWRQKDPALLQPPDPPFARIPEVEDLFVWGVYGAMQDPGYVFDDPLDNTKDQRLQQIEQVRKAADWRLLDLRRHYCNVLVQGGGMLFPRAGQSSYDYVKFCLDRAAEYGIRFAPSTYISRHYDKEATEAQAEAAMRKAAGMFGNHPGLLAYWLVDELNGDAAPDFFWGKRLMETLDPRRPSLCSMNSIDDIKSFAGILPLVCIDYYPISPVPKADRGAWGIGDSVRYARTLGARRIWLYTQAFGASSWRPPSAAEFRLQLFAGLAEGASGFLSYAYLQGPAWMGVPSENGNMVDPYGNPTALYDEMKRLGPFFRSAGALLVGAQRLPEAEASFSTDGIFDRIVSNVGRVRPAAIARAFRDARRGVRYVVAHNNTTGYSIGGTVRVSGTGPDDRVLDLFALREIPASDSGFDMLLEPGDGRLYAVGNTQTLAAVRGEVLRNRIAIERDLLELEIRVAGKMGADTAAAKAALAESDDLAAKPDSLVQALEKALSGLDAVAAANLAGPHYASVLAPLERTRTALGRINAMMNGRMAGALPADAPELKPLAETMRGLSRRFYDVQYRIDGAGPAKLVPDVSSLVADVLAFERSARVTLGL
ncbi:MAG: hypothetical protein PHR35_16115 [Kiritimatiellae bacterium]|nr:hypothetical protein [Kiritimatiellia bacterium]